MISAIGRHLTAVLAVALTLVHASPPLPSEDSFYAVPDNLESVKPGTILRHRPPPSPIAAFGFDPINLQASHQILYRTTDSLGNATATVLSVLVPHNADYTKLLSYQVAEDASNINCAPSYAFQFAHADSKMGTMVTEEEMLLIEAALERGWVVISPDFLGPKGSFLANHLSGYATLDGIRAAISSETITGISSNPTIAMWGYSGGSVASLFAAELQPSYAPELKIAGAAVGGIVPNITNVVTTVNGKGYAGLIPAGVLGLTHQYPELGPVVSQHVLPEHRADLYKAQEQCYGANNNDYANVDIVGYFDDRQLVYTNPVAVKILNENAHGHYTPKIPLFMYKSVGDEISPIPDTDALVKQYCANGANIRYHRDIKSNHGDLAIIAAAKALSYLIDTMEGRTHAEGCSTETVYSTLLDIATLEVLPKFLLDALLDLLHKPVGPIIGRAVN
ncbi:hypothetical protein VHEMI01383 [[Torrubiella] hemipterigena]|uniref:Secretory lipase family protein n=1 Tax=[Torrubiella] hemipterigena TaxID=1531966 RepID=A0A0A1SLS8_9HYPO|nr:hypothetical protein VHEMI01383 [[Torrubiella] hemipterigena]